MEFYRDTIIICDGNSKKNLLESFSSSNKLYPVTFMSKEEFKKNYLFDYDEESLVYLVNKGYTVEESLIYLDNIYYVDDCFYDSDKLDFLVALKKELNNQGLLKYNDLFKKFLFGKDVIIYQQDYLDKFYLNLFSSLKDITNVKFIKKEYNDFSHEVNIFDTIEDEVLFVAKKICSLIDEGVLPTSIKICNCSSDYYHVIKRIFDFHGLKINLRSNSSIISTEIAKYFLECYESNIENTKSKVFEKFGNNDILNKIISICNKYVFCDDFLKIKDIILYELSDTLVDSSIFEDGIDVISLGESSSDDYVFLLGMNQGFIPKIYKDEDYLSDSLKKRLGIDTSFDKNLKEKEFSIKEIKNIKNLVITSKKSSAFRSFYPSVLINEIPLKEVYPSLDFNVSYSSLCDEIILAKYLENYVKYGVIDNNLGLLYNNYKVPFMEFDNSFKGIDKSLFKSYVGSNLSLSYTSLDSYFKCGFKYYLDNILKLNIYEEKLATFIGSLFHHILEIGLTRDIDFDYEYDKYIKESLKDFSSKDKFFLEKLKGDLEFALSCIKEQEKYCSLDNYLFEEKVVVNDNADLKITFSGKIDKILYKEDGDKCIVALVDYKTGDTSCDLKYLEYGLHMQLPIYLYLASNCSKFNNVTFAGFYLQKILHKKGDIDYLNYDNDRKNLFKLVGYSNSDEEILYQFDKSYKVSEVISSMGCKKDGNFKSSSKILSNSQINNLIKFTRDKIFKAEANICNCDFSINPKRDEKFDLVSCKFCKYSDICFRTEDDIVDIKADYDLSFLGGEE